MIKKIIPLIFALLISNNISFAITAEELRSPKPKFGRLGIDFEPENKFEIIKQNSGVKKDTAIVIKNKVDYTQYTYADVSLKRLANEMSQDLDMERSAILGHVQTLWAGAATRSETISYAMYKLANPDEDKPSDSVVKKIIKPIASMTSFAGVGVSDPILATSAMVTGNVMGALSSDNKEINYKYSKVTDADMVILARKVDDLQRELTNKYCDYMSARNVLQFASDITKKRKDRAERMANRSKEEVLIADAYYREALKFENKKRAEFMAKRSALEQMVGNETLRQFETMLTKF